MLASAKPCPDEKDLRWYEKMHHDNSLIHSFIQHVFIHASLGRRFQTVEIRAWERALILTLQVHPRWVPVRGLVLESVFRGWSLS